MCGLMMFSSRKIINIKKYADCMLHSSRKRSGFGTRGSRTDRLSDIHRDIQMDYCNNNQQSTSHVAFMNKCRCATKTSERTRDSNIDLIQLSIWCCDDKRRIAIDWHVTESIAPHCHFAHVNHFEIHRTSYNRIPAKFYSTVSRNRQISRLSIYKCTLVQSQKLQNIFENLMQI